MGSVEQTCSSCDTRITIEATFGDHLSGSARERRPVAMVQGHVLKNHCGKGSCMQEVVTSHFKEEGVMTVAITEELNNGKSDRCDWCATLKRSVHRCGKCLTKVYCSQECLLTDWQKVHKLICKEESVMRKRKTNRKHSTN